MILMRKFLKIILYVLVIGSLVLACSKPNLTVASKGFLDLSNTIQLKSEPVNLEGEWEFYWDKLLEPTDFQVKNQNPSYIHVPAGWNKSVAGNSNFSSFGYATYRLVIRTNPEDSVFGIRIDKIDVAFKLWINGVMISEVGKVGSNKDQSKPKWMTVEKVFHSKLPEQEIVIEVSNFTHPIGGIVKNVEFSTEESLNDSIKSGIGLDFLFLGIILIISLYHLILFLLRRVVVSSLYFAILCVFAAALVSVSVDFSIASFVWPKLNFVAQLKLENIFYYLLILFLVLFIYSLFDRESDKKIIISALGYSSVMVLFTAVSPVSFVSSVQMVTDWLFIPIIIYLMVISGRAFLKQIEGALQSFVGLAFLVISLTNDLLYKNFVIDTYNILAVGFLAFILIQVYIISSRFVRAISYSEQLTEEMDYLNDNLEHLVKERTAKIEQQKEELEIQSESLKVANDEIVKINHILERQGGEMNKKNRALTDSLNYAKRLQGAVMPDEGYLRQVLPEHFIFFQPKDIVSGDFYWYGEVDSSWDFDDASRIQILVAADCTGHGVPGAFMTLLGHNFLNVTVNIQEVTDPEQIIYKLDQQVVDTLKQNEPNSIKDGMDIAVLSINQDKSLISFSGAGIPLYYISDGQFEEYKGSNFGIGGVLRKEKQFVPFKIEYKPGDMFYIFSDGYADQIGGKEGRKYYKKKFKEFLMEIKDHTMEEQRKLIEDEYIQWKGDYKQIDDILIIGIKM